MDIYQLKTFVAVAREGSITRASALLHLSQPAVSAHIKAIEDALGLAVFERTARGMSLTRDGERLLAKAEQALAAHQELMDEATRIKGRLAGKLRLGAGSNSNDEAVGRLLAVLSERCPEVEVVLKHGTSLDILAGIRNGSLDAGFYNESGELDPELATIEVSRFRIYVVAPPGLAAISGRPDWRSLADLPWIYPTLSACCGRAAESLFKMHQIRPKRIISVDRNDVTRTLIAGGTGVGLLHADTAKEAQARGEVELLFECPTWVRVLFAHLASRAHDPLLTAAASIIRAGEIS
ncbi:MULTISPECIES: LysR family transcriptional regulator [Sorangium]|uniref:LysR family transcriptional regulator n=1 Tax=Sorangium cellulosum TaxID=56 RepID=A0A4P2QZN9_SORCE|nr:MULTISPECIES: LysR family transcriptional regulator [Sorangium]AUX36087.1 LysR family transcriptional regulator [Sorangium cellulosum]WCQ95393.1 HTH-type transcriptional activator CmpR [Sorangium sp. Soce836]